MSKQLYNRLCDLRQRVLASKWVPSLASTDRDVEMIQDWMKELADELGDIAHEAADRISELEAEMNRYDDFVDRANAEVADLRSRLALAHRGTTGDFRHIDQQAQRIAELEAENQHLRDECKWIPVDERLPELEPDYDGSQTSELTWVTFTNEDGDRYAALGYYVVDQTDESGPHWIELDTAMEWYEGDGVIAWMPVPEPYEPDKEIK